MAAPWLGLGKSRAESEVTEMSPYVRMALLLPIPLLLACPADEPAPQQPQPDDKVAPMADPLSRMVSDRAHEAAQRRRAEGMDVVSDASTPKPMNSAFALPSCASLGKADLDGDGTQELVCWNDGRLTFWSQGEEGLYQVFHDPGREGVQPGEPQLMLADDFDGDGREELLIGWGNIRAQGLAPVSVTLSGIEGSSGGHKRTHEVIYRADSPRAEIVGLGKGDALPGGKFEIIVAHFDSRYFVTSARLRPEGDTWAASPGLKRRMATSWAFADVSGDRKLEWLVGRPYGDGKLDPGDMVVWDGTSTTQLPSLRGARSVAAADIDGDGRPEVLFGDGWHYRYGEEAKGRLVYADRADDGVWSTHLIEDTQGQIEIAQIQAVDINADGQLEIVAAGDKYIKLWYRRGQRWQGVKLADGRRFTAGTFRAGQWSLVVAGSPILLVPLVMPEP